MTTLPQQDTIKQYIADGITSDYVVPFYTPLSVIELGKPALDVYVTLDGDPPIPEDDIKVWNVDFTYEPNLDPYTGGILTFLVGKIPPLGASVTLSRDVPAELSVDFSEAKNFSGSNLDDVLIELLMIEQQNKTYALQRNLSYRVNSLLPDDVIEAMTQLPTLGNMQIWQGTGDGVIAVTLEENPDVSTLRSQLLNNSPGTAGATIVGYYNTKTSTAQTVQTGLDDAYDFSDALVEELRSDLESEDDGNDGALYVGYYDSLHAVGKTLNAMLSQIQTAMADSYQMQSSFSTSGASTTKFFTIGAGVPTVSQGDLFYSVVITPKSATSLLKITATVQFDISTATSAAFWFTKNSETDAFAAFVYRNEVHNQSVIFTHSVVSGTTDPITFKLYGASGVAATLTLNNFFGVAGGSGIAVEEFNVYS